MLSPVQTRVEIYLDQILITVIIIQILSLNYDFKNELFSKFLVFLLPRIFLCDKCILYDISEE